MRISQALNHKGPDSDLTLVRTALKSWKLHLTHTASRVVRLGGESNTAMAACLFSVALETEDLLSSKTSNETAYSR
ncbi:hypothetical protein Y1Q_0010725 [Alligator mississippiensis]|uniref:Uncharacterized protein n=1 Tax=Alligator mississippiensis TaxID=8496 RepID=A0A151M6Q6_ALLMI|nr:hypothetical protein Y1Q_0010725 [Alligator mississippiensis]